MKQIYQYIFASVLCVIIWIIGISSVSAQTKYYDPAKEWDVIQIIEWTQKKNPIISSIFEQKVRTYSNGNATWFGSQNRIANGAWILVLSLSPYIQWLVFIGMSLSVILIIYNWFNIMTNAWDDSQIKTAKDNIKHIIIGVLILWGFYFIMKLISSLLINLMWW